MNRRFALPLVLFAALALGACQDEPTAPASNVDPAFALGNGYPAPSFDYQMQIIGVPKGKSADMDSNNGHRIFVMLDGGGTVTTPGGKNNQLKESNVNKIFLCNSTNGENDVNDPRCDAWRNSHDGDFGVIDANATDSNGAMFAIPDPCADADPLTPCTPSYQIYARALAGKGFALMTTCAYEDYDTTTDIWCGSSLYLSKQTAFKAINVTDDLTHMTIGIDDSLDPQLAACVDPGTNSTDLAVDYYDVYLFDNCFENYFWNYDNNGVKNLQVRFYSNL